MEDVIAPKRPESLADARWLLESLAIAREHEDIDYRLFFSMIEDSFIDARVYGDFLALDLNWQGCLSLADLLLRLAVSDFHGEHIHAYPYGPLATWSERMTIEFILLEDEVPAAEQSAYVHLLTGTRQTDDFRRMEMFLQFDFIYDEWVIAGNQLGLRALATRVVDMAISGQPDQTQIILTPGAQLDDESFEARIRLVSLGWDAHLALLPPERVAGFTGWERDDLALFRSIRDTYRADG
jgi:hypothetical protein